MLTSIRNYEISFQELRMFKAVCGPLYTCQYASVDKGKVVVSLFTLNEELFYFLQKLAACTTCMADFCNLS